MKMLSGFKSSRVNGVIRTTLIALVSFLLIFVLMTAMNLIQLAADKKKVAARGK